MTFTQSKILSTNSSIKHGFIYMENQLNISDLSQQTGLVNIKTVKQVHGKDIVYFNDPSQFEENYEADAIVSDLAGFGVGVYTADCVPIIFIDDEKKTWGAIHAGWRGTLAGIAEKVCGYLIEKHECVAENIKVAVGPCIEGGCYEIGEEIAKQFEDHFNNTHIYLTRNEGTKYSLDLKKANVEQLKKTGITNIETIDICTKCDADYPSYRRDGKNAGRMLSFIGIV